ncbi:MAG: histidinol dehydrogenase [Bacteroidota bacterium]
MKSYFNPPPTDWSTILERPLLDTSELEATVQAILDEVQTRGDAALRDYTARFDGVALDTLRVSPAEMEAAAEQLPAELKTAIDTAYRNIRTFHQAQIQDSAVVETMPGVRCWQRSVAIEKVGLYIPGGTAPLFSTILMLGVPARLAACEEIVLCTPPQKDGSIHAAMLYTAQLIGIEQIFKVGGAQAIGAMASGTESVPAVYKIFGPGNQYVTCAKQLVNRQGLAIDMPAGPSEVLVYADASADPAFVAADLLSQAEHGLDSQAVLVTTSADLLERVERELTQQLAQLPRRSIAEPVVGQSPAITVADEATALALINSYAPEHLILASDTALDFAAGIRNAGSVFLGHYTPESVGDYASGTNHTLPTNGFARAYSGVNMDAFYKKITFQQLSTAGLQQLGPAVETMAAAEQLEAHKLAVSIRLQKLQNPS